MGARTTLTGALDGGRLHVVATVGWNTHSMVLRVHKTMAPGLGLEWRRGVARGARAGYAPQSVGNRMEHASCDHLSTRIMLPGARVKCWRTLENRV